jgi:hypothetical protein
MGYNAVKPKSKTMTKTCEGISENTSPLLDEDCFTSKLLLTKACRIPGLKLSWGPAILEFFMILLNVSK